MMSVMNEPVSFLANGLLLGKWEQFRLDVGEWSGNNFPDNTLMHPAMGMVEEVGEFWSATTDDERHDAIADCVIYMADYLFRAELTFGELIDYTGYDAILIGRNLEDTHLRVLGQLAHVALKVSQKIRTTEDHYGNICRALGQLMRLLLLVSEAMLFDNLFKDIVMPVWEKVRQRDWAAYPETGRV